MQLTGTNSSIGLIYALKKIFNNRFDIMKLEKIFNLIKLNLKSVTITDSILKKNQLLK